MRIGRTTQYRSTSVPTVGNVVSNVLTVTASTHVINDTTTIGSISGGVDGQQVTILPGTGYSVLIANGTLVIGGDVNLYGSDSITLQKWGGVWYQISRLGRPGFQGNQGDNGVGGNQGSQGNAGLVGPLGSTGPDGAVGLKGNQGPQGSDGNQGPPGAQGPQGPQGYDGNQGPQGNPCIP